MHHSEWCVIHRMMYGAPPRTLLTWTDRGPERAHHQARPARDRGPILRLLDSGEAAYTAVVVLTTAEALSATEPLLAELRERVASVEAVVVPVEDPSDYRQLFDVLPPALARLPAGPVDVVLSAGTPQAQAVWVLLVKAELLPARMLQVIPPAFVPVPHPRPVREVRLDFAGFPEIRALHAELHRLRHRVEAHGLVGESVPMVALRARLAAVARSEVPVVITGETGTGKELVARALHAGGPRAEGPFVAENCGAFAEGVLQSELFGHERGAFSGAASRRRGLFEMADRGTLMLDEVGELPLAVQASLLRVLQDGSLRRVGGERPLRVDVRVVAATHRDLGKMVKEGCFREDLYYRLRGATLDVPPLRERLADLEPLVRYFLGERRLEPTPAAWKALRTWRWPGNVRELRAEVLRWTVFCQERVMVADLSPEIQGVSPAEADRSQDQAPRPLSTVVEEAERAAIQEAWRWCQGNLSKTARVLEIDRNTLKRKLGR